ncbi:MAG: PA2779 family protein [Aquisalimonadaceae bacterium]
MQNLLSRTRLLAVPLIMMFLAVGFVSQTAVAGIVGTQTILTENAAADRAEILSLLDRDEVRDKLVKYGVSAEEAAERVAGLTDAEALELAQRIEQLPAGGSAVTILLVVILLILLL